MQRGASCVADYGFPWDRLITRLKFDGEVELARPLATLLVRAVQRDARRPPPALIVPVPLTSKRLAERGYNQAWELARRVAESVGRRARADVLQRWVDAPAQAALDRQARLANLRAAFAVDPDARSVLRGCTVALVDDVMTTGATATQCSAALLAAGAAAVDVWVFARTPPP